jgi:sugar/nucleoside kinase (ribokinase family)
MKKRVLAVGEVNMDIIFTGLTNLPRAEQDTMAQSLDIVVGGQTGTIARAMSRLGLTVTFVGRVGDDDFGHKCAEELARAGVKLDGLVLDPSLRTGSTVVLSTGRERAFATYLGSISAVRRVDITPDLLSAADHLHVGSYFLQTTLQPDVLDLFRETKRRGLTTSSDPGWDSFLNWDRGILEALANIDVFLPNEIEAMQITRTDTPEAAMDILAARGRTVVIKMGGKGCLVRSGAHSFRCPAFNVPVVDVTSAGDVFNAGFLYGFLHGWDLIDTVKFANACGAISVSKAGNTGMPDAAEVAAFLDAHGDELTIRTEL